MIETYLRKYRFPHRPERKISSNDMGIESKHNMRAKASGKTQRFSGERTMDN